MNVEELVDILLFADDLTILAADIVDLQNKLATLAKYCKIKKLEVNTKKTEIVIFKKSGRPKRLRTVKFKNIPLKVVKSYTYLGIIFLSTGSFKPALDHALSKGKSAIGAIWQILAISKNTSWDAASKLFEATVASTVLHGSGIWGLNHTMDIERRQTDFYKRLLSLPRYTAGYLIRLESGRMKLEAGVAIRAFKFLIKILRMNQNRYPWKMYKLLKCYSTTTPSKLNWISQLHPLLSKAEHEYLCNCEDPKAFEIALFKGM